MNDDERNDAWVEGNSAGSAIDGDLLAALDPGLLHSVLTWRMPFGKFETWPLLDLPEPYVVWMHRNAELEGKIGRVFALLYEIKVNGLEGLLSQISKEEIRALAKD